MALEGWGVHDLWDEAEDEADITRGFLPTTWADGVPKPAEVYHRQLEQRPRRLLLTKNTKKRKKKKERRRRHTQHHPTGQGVTSFRSSNLLSTAERPRTTWPSEETERLSPSEQRTNRSQPTRREGGDGGGNGGQEHQEDEEKSKSGRSGAFVEGMMNETPPP